MGDAGAGEPDIVDYDASFESPPQIALFEGDLSHHASDHDAVIIGLDLDRKSGKGRR